MLEFCIAFRRSNFMTWPGPTEPSVAGGEVNICNASMMASPRISR